MFNAIFSKTIDFKLYIEFYYKIDYYLFCLKWFIFPFSWHEIGAIDLPTMIDYTLEKSQAEKIFYIGHSQGTTSFFVMASTFPEYNDKIRLMVALAPVAFMENIPNIAIRLIAKLHNTIGVSKTMIETSLIQIIN